MRLGCLLWFKVRSLGPLINMSRFMRVSVYIVCTLLPPSSLSLLFAKLYGQNGLGERQVRRGAE
jgi:hypothetical protein